MHALISVVRAMCLTNRLWVGWGKVSSTHHDVLRVRRICSSSDASGRDRVYRGAWDVRSDDRSCDESHARTSVTCPPLAPLSRPGKRLLDRPRFFAWDVTPRAGAVPKRHCLSGPHVNNVGADPPLGQPTPPARSPARGRSLGRRGARRTARPAARRQTARPRDGPGRSRAASRLGAPRRCPHESQITGLAVGRKPCELFNRYFLATHVGSYSVKAYSCTVRRTGRVHEHRCETRPLKPTRTTLAISPTGHDVCSD